MKNKYILQFLNSFQKLIIINKYCVYISYVTFLLESYTFYEVFKTVCLFIHYCKYNFNVVYVFFQ